MSTRYITVSGCDDSTKIRVDLTDDENDLVTRLFAAITEHGGGCMPTAGIRSEPMSFPDWADDDYKAEALSEFPYAVIANG